jgi:hypothetical protein
MFAIGTSSGSVNPDDDADRHAWAREHDPRTQEGLGRYTGGLGDPNSPTGFSDYDFFLKYGSGTFDFMLAAAADPTVALSAVARAGRARFRNKATADYVAKGGHEREIGNRNYRNVREAALAAETPEALRERAFPGARFGGQASTVLWAAARLGDDIYRDTYLVLRGMDGLRGLDGQPFGAIERLRRSSPEIVSRMARLFANWNVGEDALAFGRDPKATNAQMSLALSDFEAFIASMNNGEGIWGKMPGKLMGEEQPRLSPLRDLRLGAHRWLVAGGTSPLRVVVGRIGSTLMPSQGYTPFLDLEDGTALGLRHFKALLERSGMDAGRVEHWVSQWGSKGERQGRGLVLERATEEAIGTVAGRHGVPVESVREAMPEILRYQRVARAVMEAGEMYVSERGARAGALAVYRGQSTEVPGYRKDVVGKTTAGGRAGRFG